MSRSHSFRQRGFTLFQLLVILALLVMLFGFLFSAVGRVRVAAARTQSANNLKQITLATINAADSYQGKLPPGPEGWYPTPRLAPNSGYGPCLFHIAPYIEQDNLYKSTLTKVGDTPVYASWSAAGKVVKTFIAPGDPTAGNTDCTSYLANSLAMPVTGARYPASFPDGTSNTILYAEAYAQATDTITWEGKKHTWKTTRRWWENPTWKPVLGDLPFQAGPPKDAASVTLPQGYTPNGINVALADGSVRLVSSQISNLTFYSACTPNGGEVLGNDW
jgi:prepilin-type processing-associated H-X9-DG protein